MSAKEEVEREIREYLEKHDNMIPMDRVKYLMAIYDKQFLFNQMAYELQYHEIINIISMAKSFAGKQTLPVIISEKHLEPQKTAHVAFIESVLAFLNASGLLKKLVQINYSTRHYKLKE